MANRALPPENRVVDRWDRVFDALRAEPRRQLVLGLLDVSTDEWVSLPDAAIGPNRAVDRETVSVELHHRHLPMLSDSGYVRWEADPLRATRGPRFEEVASVVTSLQETADRLPDRLVDGCHTLERERRDGSGLSAQR
ncbi:hypothetical protein ACFO5R_04260 [Halosolutus amylolyticus]|uniref:ArsR family transcriptional regulator n=1 Tax=Halosolutus amylolyticus TaxID=2932267 RepID=A0ABD5PKM2_9EURY|nr:hypothetical protein [Halosolutus amylolyticus]